VARAAVQAVGSAAMRTGGLHVTPSVVAENTGSFPAQTLRKRQSAQASTIRPPASTAIEGSGGVRSPGGASNWTSETCSGAEKVAPPSVDRTAAIGPLSPTRYATTTVPSGSTAGSATAPDVAATAGADQVSPPSSETCEPIAWRTTSVH